MTFTDDDLKRLKEWNAKRPVDAFPCGVGDNFISFTALLARLEAAEACIVPGLAIRDHYQCSAGGCFRCNYECWCKAAGK